MPRLPNLICESLVSARDEEYAPSWWA